MPRGKECQGTVTATRKTHRPTQAPTSPPIVRPYHTATRVLPSDKKNAVLSRIIPFRTQIVTGNASEQAQTQNRCISLLIATKKGMHFSITQPSSVTAHTTFCKQIIPHLCVVWIVVLGPLHELHRSVQVSAGLTRGVGSPNKYVK